MQQPGRFQPTILEVTKSLDLTGLSDEAAERMREEFYARSDEPILARVLGARGAAAAQRIILWHRWLQFVQSIYYRAAEEVAQFAGPKSTEELTTRYRVEAGESEEDEV